jgi:hypothetical protein
MRDPNCSFANLFDKAIPLDCEISKIEIDKLVENHKLKYPRDVDSGKVSKRKFKDYLKELGMLEWEIEIFEEARNVEGWYPVEVENLATFMITQSIIPIGSMCIIIITNATLLGIFPD